MAYRETRSSRLLRDRVRHEITAGVDSTAVKPGSAASTGAAGTTNSAASLRAKTGLAGDARAGTTTLAGTSSRIGGGLSVKNANQAAGASGSRALSRGDEFDDITNKEDHQRSSRSGSASASQQDDAAKDGGAKVPSRRAEAAAAIIARRRAAAAANASSAKTASVPVSTATAGVSRIGRTAARTTVQTGASTASAGTTSAGTSAASRLARVRDRVAGASNASAGPSAAGMTARVRTAASTARTGTSAPVEQDNRRTVKRQASGILNAVENTVEGSSAATRAVKKLKVDAEHASATVTGDTRSRARSVEGVLTERNAGAGTNTCTVAETTETGANPAAIAYYDNLLRSGSSQAHEAVLNREMGQPKDLGWANLDQDDGDDPLMVSEYVNEVFDYLKELEVKSMPKANYVVEQTEITWEHRSTLVDWLIDIHAKFRLVPETLYLAVNILDRMLSACKVAVSKLQLVGCTALFIAAKYEEVMCPSVQNFHYLSDSSFSENEILAAERYVLRKLSFNLSYPNPMNFLRRISKADDYDIQTRTVAKFFMEISTVDYRLIGHPPSVIAAAAVWLAREALDRGPWSATLVHYSSFALDELLTTAEIMVDYCLRPCRHPVFQKKYGAKKFMKACTYVLDWAKGKYKPCAEYGEPSDSTRCCVDLFEEYKFIRPTPERLQEFFGFAGSRASAAGMNIFAEMQADRLSDEMQADRPSNDEEGFDAEEEEEVYTSDEGLSV